MVGGAVIAGFFGYTVGLPGQERASTAFTGTLCFGVPLGFFTFSVFSLVWYQKFTALMDLPVVFASSDRLHPSDTLTVDYTQHFKQDSEIEALQLQLICQEWVRYTEGTSTYTDTRDIVVSEDWREGVPVTAAVDYEETFTLPVPADAMHTWTEANNNKIRWKVRLVLDMPGERDYQDDYDMIVLPEGPDA